MRILEIESLFEKEETLNQVLDKMEDDFKKVDYWAGLMKRTITNNSEEAKKALTELTGTFSNLRTVLAIADYKLENNEVRKYHSIKMQLEKDGKKFTSQIDSATKKEASVSVAKYRRIKNIIQGYVSACEKSITSLQSILKHIAEEMKLEKN